MTLPISAEDVHTALRRVDAAHVSLSKGALPFVLPTRIRMSANDEVELLTVHPTLLNCAARGDIAALQVETTRGTDRWSYVLTGPLHLASGRVTLPLSGAMISVDCLSSPHDASP